MRIHLRLFVLLLLIVTGFRELKAQSLVVKLLDGTDNTELLSSIHALKFVNGKLMVSDSSGSESGFNLTDIQKVYFSGITGITEDRTQDVNKLIVFPNPAGRFIQIRNIPDGTKNVLIYRMDGKLMLSIPASDAKESIDITSLKAGFYLLIAYNQSIKFIRL